MDEQTNEKVVAVQPVVQTKNFVLSDEARTALLTYLMDRPYKEVARGVQMLLDLKEISAAPPKE